MAESTDQGGRLDALVAEVAWPAVASVLQPHELTALSIEVSTAPHLRVSLRLAYGEEEFMDDVYDDGWGDQSPDELRERLADHLCDFIAESRLGWGQLRVPGMPGAIAPGAE